MTFGTVAPVRCDCPCGCGRYGTPRRQAWRDGLVHIRQCECSYCQASEAKRSAMKREDKIARDSGGRRNPGSGAQGGMDLAESVWQIEETSNVSVVQGFRAWISGKGVRAKFAYLMQRSTIGPRAAVLSWDDDPQWVVMPYQDWASITLELDGRRRRMALMKTSDGSVVMEQGRGT